MKNRDKWTNITNVEADLLMKSKGTKKKEDLGPFFLQWKALEALNKLVVLTMKR